MARDPRREQMLDAAARLFSRKGYAATSVNELAAAAGFTKAGLYYHVRGKEDLLEAICAESVAAILDDVEQAVAGDANPQRQLSAVIEAHVRFFHAHPERLTVLNLEMTRLSAPRRSKIVRLERRYLDALRGVLARGMDSGELARLDPSVAAFSLLSIVNGLNNWYDPKGPVGCDALIEHVKRIYLRGIVASAQPA
ncbi:MAG: TetR/AcrR family transcriptional regulator [Burkholderiaceae bacterium]|nr:TetR/AcrR family transcriptional regulator [Burkholderiaceae bacterium]